MMAKRPGDSKKGGRGVIWMQGLACTGLAALMPGVSLLAVVLLAPTIVAVLLEREPGRPVARAVFLCGLAASVGPLRVFVEMGNGSFETGFALAGDIRLLAAAWCSAAGGWLLSQIIPIGMRWVLDANSVSRSAQLHTQRETLAQDWGLN